MDITITLTDEQVLQFKRFYVLRNYDEALISERGYQDYFILLNSLSKEFLPLIAERIVNR